MAALSYRPPQFSEDTVWLPAWLQPQQVQETNEHVKDSESLIHHAEKDLVTCYEKLNSESDQSWHSREDAQNNSFHLFLSGEDSSPVTDTMSSGNVMQFCLHLSSLGITQDSSGPPENIGQTGSPGPNKAVFIPPDPCTSLVQAGKADFSSQWEISKTSSKYPEKSLGRNKSNKVQKKFNDTVEFSIAASEALVISEVMNSRTSSELLPASAIIEVALRIKEARNQNCTNMLEEASACQPDEVDETDMLSELDENSLQDAFEDVGLFTEQILATFDHPLSCKTPAKYCTDNVIAGAKQGCSSPTSSSFLVTHFDDHKPYKEIGRKDSHTRELDLVGPSHNQKFDSMGSRPLEPQLVSAYIQHDEYDGQSSCYVGFTTRSQSFPWKSAPTSSKCVAITNIHPRGKDLLKVFQKNTRGTPKNIKRLPSFFVEETSLLSESMDAVVAENSIQKPEVGTERFYQNNVGTLLSQDLVGSSNCSLVDPLCSVVPCSISSPDATEGQANDASNDKNSEDIEKQLNSTEGLIELENLPQRIVLNAALMPPLVSFPQREDSGGCNAAGEISGSVTRKQQASLRSYSTLEVAFSGVPEGAMHIKISAGETSQVPSRVLESQLASRCQEPSEPHESVVVQNHKKITSPTQMQNLDSTIRELKSDIHSEDRCFPIVWNRGARRRFRACNSSIRDAAEERLEDGSSPLKKAKLVKCKDGSECVDRSGCASPSPGSNFFEKNILKRSSVRKKVHFLEAEDKLYECRTFQERPREYHAQPESERSQKAKYSGLRSKFGNGGKESSHQRHLGPKDGKRFVFQGLEFLLTGYSANKQRELEMLIRKHGGAILDRIPPLLSRSRRRGRLNFKKQQLPLVLAPEKVQTAEFLFGCAVNAPLLKTEWLTDSVRSTYVLPTQKYLILSHQAAGNTRIRIQHPVFSRKCSCIFDRVGIMLYGKPIFCSIFVNVIKHGGGQVFKTLHWLVQSLKSGRNSVGAIVIEDEGSASRHLRQCALEQKLPIMPASWLIDCLHSGRVLPLKENGSSLSRTNISEAVEDDYLSVEI